MEWFGTAIVMSLTVAAVAVARDASGACTPPAVSVNSVRDVASPWWQLLNRQESQIRRNHPGIAHWMFELSDLVSRPEVLRLTRRPQRRGTRSGRCIACHQVRGCGVLHAFLTRYFTFHEWPEAHPGISKNVVGAQSKCFRWRRGQCPSFCIP